MKKIILTAFIALAAAASFAQLRVEAGFITEAMKVDDDKSDDNLNGVKLGAFYGIEDAVIKNSVLEFGLTFAYTNYDDLNKTRVAIPVNAGYKIELTNDFSLRPYAGMNFAFNTSFKDDNIDYMDDADCKRFQLGGQVGVLAQYKRFTLSYQFEGDWTGFESDDADKIGNFFKKDAKTTFPGSVISVGIVF